MKQTVNERVKVLRTRLTKSQTEFANDLQISVSLLSKIETGDMTVTPKMIEKINDTYVVNPENWLTEGKGELSYSKPSKQGSFDPSRDTLYKELKEQAERWHAEYLDTKAMLKMAIANMGKLKTLRYSGSQKERLRVGVN